MIKWLDRIFDWGHIVIPMIFVVIVMLLGRFSCNAQTIQDVESAIEEPVVLIQVQETNIEIKDIRHYNDLIGGV